MVDAVNSGNLIEMMNQKAILSERKTKQFSHSDAVADRVIGKKWFVSGGSRRRRKKKSRVSKEDDQIAGEVFAS